MCLTSSRASFAIDGAFASMDTATLPPIDLPTVDMLAVDMPIDVADVSSQPVQHADMMNTIDMLNEHVWHVWL